MKKAYVLHMLHIKLHDYKRSQIRLIPHWIATNAALDRNRGVKNASIHMSNRLSSSPLSR